MSKHILLRPKGSRVLLLGNEAIARGALEAGICIAAAYPGTPSTEILETLSEVADECGIYVEWSVNEKVAFEAAYAAAITGVRSLVSMKHVGLNVAADILMSSAYSGVEDGFVVVSADDPGSHSSQNEQDNRWYGLISHLPVIEPSNPREAYSLTKEAFELSSRHKIPVLLRTTTRISHTRMPITLEKDIDTARRCKGIFKQDTERWVLIPVYTRRRKVELVKTWKKIMVEEDREPFIRVLNPGRGKAIIASGIAYSYVREVLEYLDLLDKVTLIKVNMPVPLPVNTIKKTLSEVEEVLVVEELDPVVELQVKSLVSEVDTKITIHGKDLVPENYELSLEPVYRAISIFLGDNKPLPWISVGSATVDPPIPPRPPVLCAGCPHRSTFYVLKTASTKIGLKNTVYTGDIGCYTLGYQKPFETQFTSFEMGGSIGVAHGLSKTIENPLVAVIGDSTFFHAGIPPALNIVYNNGNAVVLVLDNMTTAMTGHQPHPGSGLSATRRPAPRILPERVLESIGYEVYVFNPLHVRESIEIVSKALERYRKGARVALVSRMACALDVLRKARRSGITLPVYTILGDKCTGCMACVRLTACPAIIVEHDVGKPKILRDICAGCGLCAQICPFKAIVLSNEPSVNWEKLWREP